LEHFGRTGQRIYFYFRQIYMLTLKRLQNLVFVNPQSGAISRTKNGRPPPKTSGKKPGGKITEKHAVLANL